MAQINLNTTREVTPVCYAYTTPDVGYNVGWTKIGFTERDVDIRVHEQTHTAGIEPLIHWRKNAVYEGSNETFTDKAFHSYLKKLGIERKANTEWFKIKPKDAKQVFEDFRETRGNIFTSTDPIAYKLRDEQARAVDQTIDYFNNHENAEFLWNAKPRFGKTLATYDLCLKMGFENILIVTNRPAIANSWYDDYVKFVGPKSGYYFVSRVDGLKDTPYVYSRDEYLDIIGKASDYKGCIEFVSLQDIKGSKYFGGDVDKLKELYGGRDAKGKQIGLSWDILIIDEAHEGVDTYKTDVAFDHIDRDYTLHLSGTPFKALASEKFAQDAIFNWTYADEQKAKKNWDYGKEEENPYLILPKLNLYTYQMSEIIRDRVEDGIDLDGQTEEYAFDLNEFFSTKESGRFTYEADVNKFLDALVTSEKFPFSTPELRDEIKHSFWILDRVDSAKALHKKLTNHEVFKDYQIILAAGDGKIDDDWDSKKSYDRVKEAIAKYDKTITLSVGQLTTGITIPEWTAVLMLSNMRSPALYMQAAFRSQNPHLYSEAGKHYRKENAYVFDFDPARTLDIFEKFANDLSTATRAGGGDLETRKQQIRELLNFFPVYGEDDNGQMIMLDAEKVMTIPRKIHATEVVNRGFMSNFLFANISNIFNASKEVVDILNNMPKASEGKKVADIDIDEDTKSDLFIDDNGEIDIPEEIVIGTASDLFGRKRYEAVADQIDTKLNEISDRANPAKPIEGAIISGLDESFRSGIISTAKEAYGKDLSKSTERYITNELNKTADKIIKKEYGDYKIDVNRNEIDREEEINRAKTNAEVESINQKYDSISADRKEKFISALKNKLASEEVFEQATSLVVETVETDIKRKEKRTIEEDVRDHLRGFARTIPSFLMAYGDRQTSLANFDQIVPEDVFLDVTSITLDQFRFLRDGADYRDENTGEMKHFDGQLFDEIVFNDSIKEFLNKKEQLANYFEEGSKRDIFDFIPPQKTNQIFTPKRVVIEMVDMLEVENPGCFDDPDHTFIDLYMKSGLYVAEIVKRLFRSEKIKQIYLNEKDRLDHIFAKQVYGLAPTEIIYQIALNFVLGFSDEVHIAKHNLRLLDSLEYIQKGTLEEKLDEIFD